MPEISDAELRLFIKYQSLGTPEEIMKKRSDLEADNAQQREQLRETKALVPKENETVVPKADAARLEEYKALGKPADIQAQLQEGRTASARLSETERLIAARAYVKAAGLAEETAETLVALPALATATFKVKKGKAKNERGVEVEVDLPILSVTGEKGAVEELELAKAQERFPAMKGLREADKKDRPAVPFVQQGNREGAAGATVFDRIREGRKPAKDDAKPAVKPITDRLGMSS